MPRFNMRLARGARARPADTHLAGGPLTCCRMQSKIVSIIAERCTCSKSAAISPIGCNDYPGSAADISAVARSRDSARAYPSGTPRTLSYWISVYQAINEIIALHAFDRQRDGSQLGCRAVEAGENHTAEPAAFKSDVVISEVPTGLQHGDACIHGGPVSCTASKRNSKLGWLAGQIRACARRADMRR